MTIGTTVRTLRRDKGFSTEVLAVKVGISSSTLGRLERADIIPKLAILERIAAELDTDAPTLLREAS